jgi:hypothetical protein
MSGGDGQGVGPEFLPQYQKKKKTNTKRAGKVAQIVEHLPSKFEALNSTPSHQNFFPKGSQHSTWPSVPHSIFRVYTNNKIFLNLFSLKA